MPLALAATLWKTLKFVGIALLVVVVALVGFLLWAAGGDDEGESWLELSIETFGATGGDASANGVASGPDVGRDGAAPGLLRVLCWNIAYGRGPKDDIGDLRDRATVVANLEGIARAIERSGAHIAALQEVDFDAKRTHGIDQVAFLMERLGWRYAARATTWKNNYVPFPYWPPAQHIGAIHSGQAVLSRFPITRNARLRYPQPESFAFWYNAFYLNRATQVVDVQVGGETITLLNTHLEAFDETNREAQAAQLVDLARRETKPTLLVLGDFNAPAPEATRRRDFADEPETDFTGDETIATLRQLGLAEVVATSRTRGGAEDDAVTWTFPWEAPSRQLDHLFFGAGLRLEEGGVWRPEGALSDHLPLRATFLLQPSGS